MVDHFCSWQVYIKDHEGRADKDLTEKVYNGVDRIRKGQRLPDGYDFFQNKVSFMMEWELIIACVTTISECETVTLSPC